MKVSKFLTVGLSLSTICYLLSTVLIGCGYTTRSMVSTKYKTIYIEPFVNKINITGSADSGSKYKINYPRVESEITNSVINRFLFDGNLKPTQKEKADLMLTGEIVDFVKDPLKYNYDSQNVEEYRMNLVINMKLKDLKADKILWEENGFIGYTEYYTSFYTGNVTKKSDSQAIPDALTDLARRVVERLVNEW